jgi:hypothetical protein
MMKWLLILVLAGLFQPAWAEDAKNCIQVGTTERGQSFKNVCPREIVVFWCHDHDQQGYRSGMCGPTQSDKHFYRYSTTLKPGQTNDNYYSLPPNSHIEFGACIGSYRDYKYTDQAGGYACSNPEAVQDFVIITTSGKTAEEACGRSRELAEAYENAIQSCECTKKSGVQICKTAIYSKSVPPSVLDKMKAKVRDEIRRDKTPCEPPFCMKNSRGFIGILG